MICNGEKIEMVEHFVVVFF